MKLVDTNRCMMSTWATLFSLIVILHYSSTELGSVLPHVEVIHDHTLNSQKIIIKTAYFEKIEDVHEDGTIFGECIYKFNAELKSIRYVVSEETFFFLGDNKKKPTNAEVRENEYSPDRGDSHGAPEGAPTYQNSYDDQFRTVDHLNFILPYPVQAHVGNIASTLKQEKIFKYNYENTAHIEPKSVETEIDNKSFYTQANDKVSTTSRNVDYFSEKAEENSVSFKNSSEVYNNENKNTQNYAEMNSSVKSEIAPSKNSAITTSEYLEHHRSNREIAPLNCEESTLASRVKRDIEQEIHKSAEVTTPASSFTNQFQKSDSDATYLPEQLLSSTSLPSTERTILNKLPQENHYSEQNNEKTSKENVLVISVPVVDLVRVDFVLTK